MKYLIEEAKVVAAHQRKEPPLTREFSLFGSGTVIYTL